MAINAARRPTINISSQPVKIPAASIQNPINFVN